MTKEAENELLKAANANLQQEVVLLKEKVMELLKIIEKKGVKKIAITVTIHRVVIKGNLKEIRVYTRKQDVNQGDSQGIKGIR